MVIKLAGNSEHSAHAWRKTVFYEEKNQICESCRSPTNALDRSNYLFHSRRSELVILKYFLNS